MKNFSRILISFILSFILFFNFFTQPIFALPSNYDYFKSLEQNNLWDYIDAKRINSDNAVFCIGQDIIHYYELFSDEERDYPLTSSFTITGKITKSNDLLGEIVKQAKDGSLEVKYEHNPNFYDNPVSKNPKDDGKWHKVKAFFKSDANKHELVNLAASDFLFFEPTDEWRGEIKISIRGSDSTGNDAFDRTAEHFAIFRVHKPPVPIPKMTLSPGKVVLEDNGSYDLDYNIRKNTRVNKPNDRQYSGIKEFYWSIQFNDSEWIDVGTGPRVEYSLSGKTVTDIRLTVEDYDGAFASISKKALILDKPIANFDYLVGGKYATYVYRGNQRHESLSVSPNITWFDEAYNDWMYNTSGKRLETWTAVKTGENRNSSNAYSNELLKPKDKFNSLVSGQQVSTQLIVSNKYDLTDEITKTIQVKDIDIVDRTESNYDNKNGFKVGTKATFTIDLTSAQAIDCNELYVEIKSSDLGSNKILDKIGENRFEGSINLSDTPSLWNSFNYSINVYSKRTGELLHVVNRTALIHTPLDLIGYINWQRENIELIAGEPFKINAKTNKYAEKVMIKVRKEDGTYLIGNEANAVLLNFISSSGDIKRWEKEFVIPETLITEETNIEVLYRAVSYNKRDEAFDVVNAKISAIKLFDFRVFDIRDRRFQSLFTGGLEFYVPDLAIDKTDHPNGLLMKKGYSFYFDVKSRGLGKAADSIRIRPRFFTADTYEELDMYYSDKGTPYILATTPPSNRDSNDTFKIYFEQSKKNLLGYHNELHLPTSLRTIVGSTQIWKGRYGVPATAIFVRKGEDPSIIANRIKGPVIINFDIEGLQNGIPKYNYISKGQWDKERKDAAGNPRNLYKFNLYNEGDVILIDASKDVRDDYDPETTHN